MTYEYSRDPMIQEKLKELQHWITTQNDLPDNIEPMLLLRYLKTYKFNLEKAQSLLKYSFELRAKNPLIFTDRDFLSPEIQKVNQICDLIPMLKVNEHNYKTCIFRLREYNSDEFNFNDAIKAFYMVADVRLISPDPDPLNMADGEAPIFDMSGVSIWHIFKVTFSTLRLYFKYQQEAQPIRAKQIHVVNCTSLLNRIMSLIKPLLRDDVAKRFHFHEPNSDTIFDFFPRDMLPEEYGGTAGSLSDLKQYWIDIFMKNRKYIMDDSNWIVTKRDDQNNNTEKSDITRN